MNKVPDNLTASRPLDIGAEPDFSLGDILVRPSLREASVGDRIESVEPRVMQVLVALVRAEGDVVSRDRLMEQCWGGRLVGDDAINSCVAKVRGLASLTTPPAFEIETVPRVGYRLHQRIDSIQPSKEGPAKSKRKQFPWRVVAVLVAAVAAIATAGVAMLFFNSTPREWVVAESHMQFIATPLVERSPTFSPDGTIIGYSAGVDLAHRRIYLRLRTGGEPILLTKDTIGGYIPVWSPDGNTIAYLIYEPQKPCRIMLISVPAGSSRQVGQCRTVGFSWLAWDRAGDGLFYVDRSDAGQPAHIFRLDLSTGLKTVLKRNAPATTDDSPLSVSPDGKTLMILRTMGLGFSQIVFHPLPDGAERVFISGNDLDLNAAWASDSKAVFVARTSQWESSLWAYPISGTAPQRITTSAITIDSLSSGPDGLIALDLQSSKSDMAFATSSADIQPSIFDRSGLDVKSFDYANDGTLAVIAQQSETVGIWLAEPGKPFHQLLRMAVCGCGLRWSPDATRMAYLSQEHGRFLISVVNREGGPVARFESAHEVSSVDWAADGKSLLTTRRDEHGWRIWRTDLEHRDRSVALLDYGWMFIRTHGTRMFAIKAGSSGIWRIDGRPQRLTSWPPQAAPWFWTVTKDGVVYPDFSDPEHPRFWALPAEGGKAVPMGYAAALTDDSTLAVDPKSKRVLYPHAISENADIGWIKLTTK